MKHSYPAAALNKYIYLNFQVISICDILDYNKIDLRSTDVTILNKKEKG